MRALALAVLPLAFLGACQPGVAPLTDEEIGALNELRAAYVEGVLANDCGAITAAFAQDAVSMPPNEPTIEGRAAYRDWCEVRATEAPRDWGL